MRKTLLYKGFYLSICKSKFESINWVGTIYHKKFDKYIWWTSYHYYNKVITDEIQEECLVTRMKKEVDSFLEKFRKYLEQQIRDKEFQLDNLRTDLYYLLKGE